MEITMSKDYRIILGKLSMDSSFIERFFNSMDEALKGYSITEEERKKLSLLSIERFKEYKEATIQRMCDCDSCCNGGEGKGNCSECSSSCCQ